MKKLTFAILGMGNRGTVYAKNICNYPDRAQVVAISDTRRVRLDSANKFLQLDESRLFASAEQLLEQPKLADMMVVATQDAQHKDHAIRALEKGYDLILEKPISNRLQDVADIADAAKKLGRTVFVSHVLRYTPFYRQIKELLQQGTVGRIMAVEACEYVGYYHQAHSFVRGNWHNSEQCCPMILAKSCHDMDILLWLIDEPCLRVNSFGDLSYFKRENAPADSAERCRDCKVPCPYNAQEFYLKSIPGWPANVLHPEPCAENILKALDETDYGRCVFKMDNDVVDHQTCNMQFANGAVATFHMSAFNNKWTRYIRIMGTEGEIWGTMGDNKVHWQRFGEQEHTIELNAEQVNASGHSGGDSGLVYDVIRYMQGEEFDTSSVTLIERSVDSHYLAFACEHSRLHDGSLVDFGEYKKQLSK
ncbi:MAG: Gfo/Idh/MocA family oxidoreductase [Clostridia bacterium]|nr:Gfo/Idh/MocA family oxidoreductase [Clostridia bacterium]